MHHGSLAKTIHQGTLMGEQRCWAAEEMLVGQRLGEKTGRGSLLNRPSGSPNDSLCPGSKLILTLSAPAVSGKQYFPAPSIFVITARKIAEKCTQLFSSTIKNDADSLQESALSHEQTPCLLFNEEIISTANSLPCTVWLNQGIAQW